MKRRRANCPAALWRSGIGEAKGGATELRRGAWRHGFTTRSVVPPWRRRCGTRAGRASWPVLPYDQVMSRFGSQYHVARSTGVCAATGHVIEPGSVCVATLCEREEDDGLDRLDYSLEAWEGGSRPERLFSFWRTTVRGAGEKRSPLVDDEVLMDLFDRLAEDERPQRVAFRFVLSLILMRKRLLRFVGRRPSDGEGEERWFYRRKGSNPDEPAVAVRNPQLSDDDVRELTAQLGEILQGEF